MSKINELVQTLCPDGVEWKKIRDVYVRLRGTPITAGKMKEIADENGDIRVFAGGKTVIDTFEKDIPDANVIRVPAVLVQSRGIIDFVYYDKPFTFKNEMWAYTHEDEMCVKYLYYVLKNHLRKFKNEASGMGSMPQISLGVTEDFIIPVPPRPVQEEIVRILDEYTNLEAELEAKLSEEIELKQKQYEFYRDELLTFGDDVEYKSLKDLYEYRRGSFPQPYTNMSFYGGDNAAPFVQVADVCDDGFCLADKTKQTISKIAQPKSVFVKKGTVIVTLQGTIGRVAITQYDAYVDRTLAIFTKCKVSDLNKQYFSYCLKSIFDEKKKLARGSTIKTITKEEFSEFVIPVPSITEQERIVKILDKYDTYTRDMISALNTELESRKKQYAYYRDQLLTFKERSDA